MRIEEGDYAIVETVGSSDRSLGIIEFREADRRVSIDHGLLVDPSNAFEITNIESILRDKIPRMLSLDLVGVILGFTLCLLKSRDLGLCEDNSLLSCLRLEDLKPFLEGLEVVAKPDSANAGG